MTTIYSGCPLPVTITITPGITENAMSPRGIPRNPHSSHLLALRPHVRVSIMRMMEVRTCRVVVRLGVRVALRAQAWERCHLQRCLHPRSLGSLLEEPV